MNKNSYIKERLQKDQLISKKAEDVFNNFLKGDFIMEEKIEKKEEKNVETRKTPLMKRMLATAASLVVVFGMANVYATTQGYGNVFFMIKYLVTGENATITDKDEILSDRDISISYEPIKLTENIRMQIRNLQVKDNEAKLIIAVNEAGEEDSSIVPLNYKVYNSANELLCQQESSKEKGEIEYIEELILNNFKENDNILIFEVYKANDSKIVKITIDLQSRNITVEGEEEALKKVSEIELKKYLGVVSEYNGEPKGEEGKIKYAQAIFNEIKGESENNVDEINNMLESLGIEKVSDSFTKGEDYKKTTKNGTSYYEVINGWDEWPYTVLDITDMSYCDGLYTATFTYIMIQEADSFDTDYSNIEKYTAMVYFRVNDDDKYSKFKFVKYEEENINTSVKSDKSNLSGDWKFVSAKLDGKEVELSEVFGSGLRYGEGNLALNSDGTFELNMPGVSSSEFSNNGKYTVSGNEIALKYSDNRTENLIYNKSEEVIEQKYGEYVLILRKDEEKENNRTISKSEVEEILNEKYLKIEKVMFSADTYFELAKEDENGMRRILNFEEALSEDFTENMINNFKANLPMGVREENDSYYYVDWGGDFPYGGLDKFENLETSSNKITADAIIKMVDYEDNLLPSKKCKIVVVKNDGKWLVDSFGSIYDFIDLKHEGTETNDTDNENVKKAFQDYLDLISAQESSPSEMLMKLELIKDDKNGTARERGFAKTNVKYSDFKEIMLSYVTENCYKKDFSEYYIEEDGYLCYMNVGATGIKYEVKSIEGNGEVWNAYRADTVWYQEEAKENISFDFMIEYNSNGKIVIDYAAEHED